MSLPNHIYTLGYGWIALHKHIKIITQVSCPGFFRVMKGMLHLNFVQKQFHLSFNYPVCYDAPRLSSWERYFTDFLRLWISAFPAGWVFSVVLSYFLPATPFWLSIIFPIISNLLTTLYCRPAWCFLHSNVTWNSHWITITLAVWKNIFTKTGCSVEYAILIAVASWYHQGQHIFQDYRTQRH